MNVYMSESGDTQKSNTSTSISSNLGINPEYVYESTFWPKILCFVRSALQVDLQTERPLHSFSHEELYRSIYWMCWQGFQKRLYSDINLLIEETLNILGNQLENNQQIESWIENFRQICVNHAKAIDVLGSVFAYLDKTYLQYTLHSNLRSLLVDRFQHLITDKSEMRIIFLFNMILDNPGMFDLNVVIEIVKALYKINPVNIYLNPSLFQNFIEGMKIPNNFDDFRVRHVTLETKYQLETLKSEGWQPGFSQLKRPLTMIELNEEEIQEIQEIQGIRQGGESSSKRHQSS
ncbi:hypothetical protein Glove_292g21 [Diversispora epigaea]|uniref:Cullin N-terminal domain-containing protein n=1 Tax=Diversispora epigaea TaxID=1348612 RepID=A0A397HZY1_9GLOM|nr:hypothetical protein Glove_292g21 [Diversispora epigaea]